VSFVEERFEEFSSFSWRFPSASWECIKPAEKKRIKKCIINFENEQQKTTFLLAWGKKDDL